MSLTRCPPTPQHENTYDAMRDAASRTGDASREWIEGPPKSEPSPAMRHDDPEYLLKSTKRALDSEAGESIADE